MNKPEANALRLHEDAEFFREAVRFTAAETGFIQRLIEKDYFCTLLLQHLCSHDRTLVLKGGTCLAKVHAGFYRLSEDLDFAISMPHDAGKSARSRTASRFKRAVQDIPDALPVFQIAERLKGANSSKQYTAVVTHASVLGSSPETIKLELGLREPIVLPTHTGAAQTLLLDPIRNHPAADAIEVSCLARQEAMAEKLRAALSRREVAIRDFYDLDHAVQIQGLNTLDRELLQLVTQKLAVPGNDAADVSDARLLALRQQLDSELKPVLRVSDFERFDLNRAFALVRAVAAAIA